MKDVLYVPGLKKNLLSILDLDKKGFRVSFIDGQALMWPKGKNIEDVVIIGEEEGGLYKPKGHLEIDFVHESTDPSELWHRRLAHINYKDLPHVKKVVMGLPGMKIKHEGIFKGCAKGKNTKKTFPSSESKEIIHSDVCGPMSSS